MLAPKHKGAMKIIGDKVYITADEIVGTCTDRQSQETNIYWTRDDNTLQVETSDITFITKMKNTMQRDPDHYKCYYHKCNVDKETGKVFAYVFEVDKKLLSFRVSSPKRELSEEEKEVVKARLKNNSKL